jgi:hypothetical protein
LGGFFESDLKQIPLCPPFSKGDFDAEAYFRISSKSPIGCLIDSLRALSYNFLYGSGKEFRNLCSAAGRSFCGDRGIPFTILAFFPEYQRKEYRSPKLEEMVEAFQTVKAAGLKNVRLGNTGIFAHAEDQIQTLRQKVGMGHF